MNIHQKVFLITSITIQKGINFPQLAISRLLNGKELSEKVRFEEIKNKVLIYLEQKKEAHISDISSDLDCEIKEVIGALKELKRQGLVKEKTDLN